ncbi:uncharacterized protein EI97DRAFT_502212 [Westerdykella ornata]|uniref:Uncharacterized protein n=1 Tax=Westerdykella ornata TaxID=318751 RepID=A0A6A6JFW1_WESOR|nr:uncharacterized protein EI97DRAFT_502212 [Westerdykella ornata]KAF2275302.1 hypothetical protein EI97DRAFT_502212 [Westerdykella ornata]
MVNWSSVEDAKLLAGILEFTNIPMNKGLLEYLAAKIGQDCTPKAVSHRLANIKNRAKGTGGGSSGGKGSTLSTPSTPKTPRSKSLATTTGLLGVKASGKKTGKTVVSNGFGGIRDGKGNATYVSDGDDDSGEDVFGGGGMRGVGAGAGGGRANGNGNGNGARGGGGGGKRKRSTLLDSRRGDEHGDEDREGGGEEDGDGAEKRIKLEEVDEEEDEEESYDLESEYV